MTYGRSALLGGALALSALIAMPVAGSDDQDEIVYRQRFDQLQLAFKTGLGLENYEPLEHLQGAVDAHPLPVAPKNHGSIESSALQVARDYAERNNSKAFIVWRNGVVERADYFKGFSNTETFPSRSLAKPMTAIAIGRAIALGHIRSLDQPVADFVKEWKDDPLRSRILIRHLLDMRSGFLPQAAATRPDDILNRAYLHPRHDEIIVNEYPVVNVPGSRYEYNNATSELVAVLIERATGRRYGQFLATEILQKIGAAGGEIWINRPGGVAHAGCCLMLTAETWVRIAALLLEDGVWERQRLLPVGYVDEMRKGTAENPYYGLGVYVAGKYTERRGFANPDREPFARGVLHSEPYLAEDLFLFDGNANQVVYIVPSERLIILRVGDNPPRTAEAEWDNSFLPNTVIRGISRKTVE